MSLKRRLQRRRRIRRAMRRVLKISACAAILCAAVYFGLDWYFPFPSHLLASTPQSSIVQARNGEVILNTVGSDDQRRVPVPLARMSHWLAKATIAAEDARFHDHFGVDPLAVLRATWQNICGRRVVSGASTLPMQVCRMIEPRPRTLSAKLIEAFRATQLARRFERDAILEAYLNLAPYGGNRRGVESAAQAYWGRHATDLSLDEAAMLAGLPQSPERYRPDRFPEAAKRRRDWVLNRMHAMGFIDADQACAAQSAPVRLNAPRPTPAVPAVGWAALAHRPAGGVSTIDWSVQQEIEELAASYVSSLPAGSQAAVVMIDIPSAEIRAWIGAANPHDPITGRIDGVLARRSPGSTLKPFVYAAAFESGRLAPDSLIDDIPIERAGWRPGNFEPRFAGAVRVEDALRRSLNVPAILVAEQVGLQRCLGLMRAAGVALPADRARRAGLGVVVGAVEASLLDVTNAYATLGRRGIYRAPRLFADEPAPPRDALDSNVCDAIDQILATTHRENEALRKSSHGWFMSKTGTSSGRRDAWAVGHNRRVAVGVWVGRFSGAGHHAYVGKIAAQPLLETIFSLPEVRNDVTVTGPARWNVEHPLPAPIEKSEQLKILTPHAGARFFAVDRTAPVHARANRTENVFWYLNGACVGSDAALRLVLPPGRYELRCSNGAAQFDAIEFVVEG